MYIYRWSSWRLELRDGKLLRILDQGAQIIDKKKSVSGTEDSMTVREHSCYMPDAVLVLIALLNDEQYSIAWVHQRLLIYLLTVQLLASSKNILLILEIMNKH